MYKETIPSSEPYDIAVGNGELSGQTDVPNMPLSNFERIRTEYAYYKPYKYNTEIIVPAFEKASRKLPDLQLRLENTPTKLVSLLWAGGMIARCNEITTDLATEITTFKSYIFKENADN